MLAIGRKGKPRRLCNRAHRAAREIFLTVIVALYNQ